MRAVQRLLHCSIAYVRVERTEALLVNVLVSTLLGATNKETNNRM